MTTSRKTLGICDVCGFRYRLRDLKKTSYGVYNQAKRNMEKQ